MLHFVEMLVEALERGGPESAVGHVLEIISSNNVGRAAKSGIEAACAEVADHLQNFSDAMTRLAPDLFTA